jgi:hypothetical protein
MCWTCFSESFPPRHVQLAAARKKRSTFWAVIMRPFTVVFAWIMGRAQPRATVPPSRPGVGATQREVAQAEERLRRMLKACGFNFSPDEIASLSNRDFDDAWAWASAVGESRSPMPEWLWWRRDRA